MSNILKDGRVYKKTPIGLYQKNSTMSCYLTKERWDIFKDMVENTLHNGGVMMYIIPTESRFLESAPTHWIYLTDKDPVAGQLTNILDTLTKKDH